MSEKNCCCWCGSIDIKYIVLFFVQCNSCGEVQGLMDLKDSSEIPLNERKRGKR